MDIEIKKETAREFGPCPHCGIPCEVRYLEKQKAYLYIELDPQGKLLMCHYLNPEHGEPIGPE